MIRDSIIIAAVAASVFIGGWAIGSSGVKVGHCHCCPDCQAIGIYWRVEVKPNPKPRPSPHGDHE